MNRLQHKEKAFVRKMQISQVQVFIFVEGEECDPFFYGKICESVEKSIPFSYRIISAKELPDSSGGKAVLLRFFDYLRKRKKLISRFKGKSMVVLFYVDKDIDDLMRTKRRSDHVVYTKYYEVENYIFLEGDLVNGSAAAASLDPQILVNIFGDSRKWCNLAAEKWQEWIIMCIFVNKCGINSQCNYRVVSQINTPLNGAINPRIYHLKLDQIRRAFRGSADDFNESYQSVTRSVTEYFQKGEHDRIFKGKWYCALLVEAIKEAAGNRSININRLNSRLTSTVALTLNFNDSWANDLKKPLKSILRQL